MSDKTIIVSSDADADECNRLYGERYGVDWEYEDASTESLRRMAAFCGAAVQLTYGEIVSETKMPVLTYEETVAGAWMLRDECGKLFYVSKDMESALAHAAHATQVLPELIRLGEEFRKFVVHVREMAPGGADELLESIDAVLHRAEHGKAD